MRYILIIATVVILAFASYFLISPRVEQKHEYEDEAAYAGCKVSVLVYISPYCRYCTAAKKLLDDLHMPYEEVNIHNNPAMRAQMIERTGRKTVPQIYLNDNHVGGFDDFKALSDSGKLKKFRQTCDAAELK